MSISRETAKENLIKLTERFRSEYEAGKTNDYTEEDTKHSFIGPLLSTVLGWDITNRDEVVMEQKISRGRIDYGIKLNGKYVFFVEAKPVRADLEKAIPQAVQYCFNRKDVPFVMLTDYEGLMFFDATFKPEKRHTKKGLKINLKWDKYVECFDELWQLSKPSVEQGSLEKLFTKKAKDRVSVDKAILEDLEGWRAHLAKDLHKNNPELFHSKDREKDAEYLKEVTQKLLDRIIFIRFCEDRNLTQIRKMHPRFEERGENTGLNTMYILGGVFKEYEAIFNSDLFKQQEWEKDLKIEFKVMNRIVEETYEPYMFDAIPLEVLGNIYEQYLGYTLKLAGDTVKAEEKPEVRKAGGVYYTPEYIVDYIVKNTVGRMLEELPEAKAKKITILDPACGSGSFLIRAYEEMLSYYQRMKKSGKSKIKVAEGQTAIDVEDADVKLTIQEKADILKTHIFGVDIDEQAVEVTKLSLMLKMLEGEWGMVKGTQLLPMLDKNIKCGNSLVTGGQIELYEFLKEDFSKLKSIDWENDFKEIILDDKGFDVIIGNPPYGADLTELERKYLEAKFGLGSTDTACLFMGLAKKLLKKDGLSSYIVPKPFVYASNWEMIREMLMEGLIGIVDCKKVWKEVKLEQVIYIYKAGYNSKTYQSSERVGEKIQFLSEMDKEDVKLFGFLINGISEEELILGRKIRASGGMLNDYITNSRGAMLQKFVTSKKSGFKVIGGKQIKRYFISENVKGYLTQKAIKEDNKGMINPDSVLVQNIVAHIENPSPHIKIIAAQMKGKEISNYIILDTVNQLTNKGIIDSNFITAVLNSNLTAWYVYRFIFGKAIRTMHFDNFITERIPVPKVSDNTEIYDRIVKLVDVLRSLTPQEDADIEANNNRVSRIEFEINELVFKYYKLTAQEMKLVIRP